MRMKVTLFALKQFLHSYHLAFPGRICPGKFLPAVETFLADGLYGVGYAYTSVSFACSSSAKGSARRWARLLNPFTVIYK